MDILEGATSAFYFVVNEENIMQYIKKVNKIEAIQNKGNVLTDVIPFLNNHGIAFKYTDSFIEGKQISVMLHKREYTVLNLDEYLVINKGVNDLTGERPMRRGFREGTPR